METKPFWGHFEEPAKQSPLNCDSHLSQKTMTRQQREEPDHSIHMHQTKTMTKTIEESDQDEQHICFKAVPLENNFGTRTLTEAREEDDQDAQHSGYTAI